MPNPEHVSRLKAGIDSWNAWRSDSREPPDLRDADLRGLKLTRVGLANTRAADFTHARLDNADLTGAELRGADFTLASLRGARLTKCDLREAYFHVADLTDAVLAGADLRGTDFMKATLARTDVTACKIQYTGFDLVNLSTVAGLATCEHVGPSDIGFATLSRSGELPVEFLRGCGLPDVIIQYLPSLLVDPLGIYFCFISYSHADKAFADRLFEALQAGGIRCWKDDHSIRLGDDIRDKVDEGIRLSKKVILVCSQNSLKSVWVIDEIEKALQKEEQLYKENGRRVPILIPLLLDQSLFDWVDGRASHLRSRLAGDFRNWTDPSAFAEQCLRLMSSLRGQH